MHPTMLPISALLTTLIVTALAQRIQPDFPSPGLPNNQGAGLPNNQGAYSTNTQQPYPQQAPFPAYPNTKPGLPGTNPYLGGQIPNPNTAQNYNPNTAPNYNPNTAPNYNPQTAPNYNPALGNVQPNTPLSGVTPYPQTPTQLQTKPDNSPKASLSGLMSKLNQLYKPHVNVSDDFLNDTSTFNNNDTLNNSSVDSAIAQIATILTPNKPTTANGAIHSNRYTTQSTTGFIPPVLPTPPTNIEQTPNASTTATNTSETPTSTGIKSTTIFGHVINVNVTSGDQEAAVPPYKVSNKCLDSLYLDDFCTDITTEVKKHFNYYFSLQHIIDDIFDPLVITELKDCPDGNWCLSDSAHQTVKDNADSFYDTYCVNVGYWSMRSCLFKMKTQRPDCNDEMVQFMYDSVELLCKMWDAEFMELECYTRTKKALYVMFRQLQDKTPKLLDLSTCNNYLVESLKTYLCADDACHFDQQELLQNFEAWRLMAIDSDYFSYQCHLNRSECQGDTSTAGYYYDYGDYYSDESDESDEYNNYPDYSLFDKILNSVNSGSAQEESELGNEFVSPKPSFDSGEKAILAGLLVAVIVLSASFLLLLVIGFKRFHKYRTSAFPVYSKLATDEDLRRAEFS